jgi:hypothetical protein
MGGLKKRKVEKRLARRIKAFESIGNMQTQNPGKQQGANFHIMHRPGSGKR